MIQSCEAYCHGTAGPAMPDHAAVAAILYDADGREVRRAARYLGTHIRVGHVRAPGAPLVADLVAVLLALDLVPDGPPCNIYTSGEFAAAILEGRVRPNVFQALADLVRAAVAGRNARIAGVGFSDSRIAMAKELADAELRQRSCLFGRPAGGWLP